MEEAHPGWCPALPYELPGGAGDGSLEGSLEAGLGRVRSVPGPLPGELVGRIEQDGVLNGVPEADVLANLVDAESALNVASPSYKILPLNVL